MRINLLAMFFISTMAQASQDKLAELYQSMLFVENVPSQHGYGSGPKDGAQYVFPIVSTNEERQIKRKVLYLIGTNLADNKIHYKSTLNVSPNNEHNGVAVFVRERGENVNYNLISINNRRDLDDKFYVTQYVKDEATKQKVSLLVERDFKQRYGFPLNEVTLDACNNKPVETYQVFRRGSDEIYYYTAECTKWGGEISTGESITALFRRMPNGEYYLLWKILFSEGWEWEGGNPFTTRYVGDLDNDGNIEVFLSKYQVLSSTTYLAELQKNGADVILEIRSDFEGEAESYPVNRYDNLLFHDPIK